MRPKIRDALDRAVHLADAGENSDALNNDALKLVDSANAFPNKTGLEVMEINQIRSFVINRRHDGQP